MEKVIEILDRKVEWIAIFLGGAFALFMVWTYVLTPVATVEVNGQKLGPGEVDPHTLTHIGKELESRMAENAKLPATVPSYVDNFKQSMNWVGAEPVSLAGLWPVLKQDIPTPAAPVDPNAPQPPPGAPAVVANNNAVQPPGGNNNNKV